MRKIIVATDPAYTLKPSEGEGSWIESDIQGLPGLREAAAVTCRES